MAKAKRATRKKYERSQILLPKEEIIFAEKVQKPSFLPLFVFFLIGCFIGFLILLTSGLFLFEKRYQNKIYPGIKIEGINFGGQKKEVVEKFFQEKSAKFDKLTITFLYQEPVATISGKQLNFSYNGKLLADQAYIMGRSGNFFSDTFVKLMALRSQVDLPISLYLNDNKLDGLLTTFSQAINTPSLDALFQFQNKRVVAFRASKNGKELDKLETKARFYQVLKDFNQQADFPNNINFPLTVVVIKPKVTTQQANNLGIKELIGSGTSTFYHSIPNRIYNISLAASRLNGVLITPSETFSFNKALGDVSFLTGYKQAYIIKDGKTILGDGGGVCQVSTTLFRAALNAGLAITERWPHSYRVGYYEQDSPPGLDATVYDPSNDLKILNDTPSYVLIQAVADTENYRLTFFLYGQKDGRKSFVTKPKVWDQTAPPPDLYQDDPSLPKGEVKQIDFSAWGAKASFDYKIEKAGQTIFQKTFYSEYRPWQAVYLRGTKE